ncbi:MAG: CBS domain-containing protein [Candidatus Azotimanducaceae bacterium]|jgi:CBS domain-containing protein
MPSVRDLLSEKGNEVWSIGPSMSVYQAVEMMAQKEVGALTVVDDAGLLIGIISERDYARKIILEDRSSKETKVSEIMTTTVIATDEATSVDECMALVTHRRIRHLPVVKDGKLIGMVSVGDLVKSVLSDRDFKIEQLEKYVRG